MKRVISSTESNTISVDAFDAGKIYVVNHSGHVYKLVSVSNRLYDDERWIFKSIHDSQSGSRGYYDTAKEAIVAEICAEDDVWEFESVREFAQWMFDNVEE